VRRRREEVTGVDFAIRARRSSLQRTIRSLSMVADSVCRVVRVSVRVSNIVVVVDSR